MIQTYPDTTTPVEYTLAPGGTPADYTGMDRFGRIVNLLWKQNSTPLVELKYGYDLASNRKYRRDEIARSISAKFDELYNYDGLQQLTVFARGELNNNNNGLTSGTLAHAWNLDATGNWKGFDQFVANPFSTTRAHNTVNEITGITTVSGSPTWDTPPGYDDNGNMTAMPSPLDVGDTIEATYDAWNRLVKTDDGTTVVEYAYDGMNRRITKTSGGTVRHFYYSDQWQVLEEKLNSSGSADKQYVWGLRYIDDLVLRDTPSERLYALQDALFNVVALIDDDGDVVERFAYQPYGQSEELNPDYSIYSGTNYNWVYRFTGRELDLETGLQINRMRYLHLQLGRWLTRDPIGYFSGIHLYRYASSDPTGLTDSNGLVTMTTDPPNMNAVAGMPVYIWPGLQNTAHTQFCVRVSGCEARIAGTNIPVPGGDNIVDVGSNCGTNPGPVFDFSYDVECTAHLNIEFKLFIHMNPGHPNFNKRRQTAEGWYGHEQAHVQMMLAEIAQQWNNPNTPWVAAAAALDGLQFDDCGACQTARDALQALIANSNLYSRGFQHGFGNNGHPQNNVGQPPVNGVLPNPVYGGNPNHPGYQPHDFTDSADGGLAQLKSEGWTCADAKIPSRVPGGVIDLWHTINRPELNRRQKNR